jgi:S-adenosyl-L-methionine hydrolase (adenosine-forming)
MSHPIVTLTTDFGAGPYLAQMKGVMLGYHSRIQFVDVTHEIAPQGIRQAAIVLGDVVASFPAQTMHLVVVDPGVGSDRAILYVEAGDWRFVLPDNGLISVIAGKYPIHRIIHLSNPKYFSPKISATFHGRDIMSHVIGHLLQGTDPSVMGSLANDFEKISVPQPIVTVNKSVSGEILFLDHFGNAISNIRREDIRQAFGRDLHTKESLSISIAGLQKTPTWCQNYSEQTVGDFVVLFDSQNRLELAVVNGHAGKSLGLVEGMSLIAAR